MDRIEVWLMERNFSESQKEPFLWCGIVMVVFHFDGKAARDMGAKTDSEVAKEEAGRRCLIGLVGCYRPPVCGMTLDIPQLS